MSQINDFSDELIKIKSLNNDYLSYLRVYCEDMLDSINETDKNISRIKESVLSSIKKINGFIFILNESLFSKEGFSNKTKIDIEKEFEVLEGLLLSIESLTKSERLIDLHKKTEHYRFHSIESYDTLELIEDLTNKTESV